MANRTHQAYRALHRAALRAAKEAKPTPPVPPYWRPQTRGDCIGMPRPCPYYGCRHHLGLDINHAGSIRMTFGEDIEQMPDTCSLDVADRGEEDINGVADKLNYDRERARQLILLAQQSLVQALARDENLAEAHRKGLAGLGPNHTVLNQPK